VLTISKLKRWSINYYIDTAATASRARTDLQRTNGGLGEYYSEHESRTPVWLCAGDTRRAAALVGLTDGQRTGGEADSAVVARWLDEGIAPNGARGRALGNASVHGFDLTFAAPKSVSLLRALTDDLGAKVMAHAHTRAMDAAMAYLHEHAGYTRVHSTETGRKDLVRLPGLVAIAYQHETSRCGDPHLHTHVIVPNRQARADGALVSIDATSLYHEAKAAGIICQPRCAASCTPSEDTSSPRSMSTPGWPRSPGSVRSRFGRGRSAPPNYGNGPPTTSKLCRGRCRRRSWPRRRKPPDPPNPKNSPGPSCSSSGAPTRAV